MTFLGRTPYSYLRNIGQLHKYAWYCLKSIAIFKDPIFVLYHYFTSAPPSRRQVKLRNGLSIHLSDHPADLITVFLVFVKEDYGTIQPGDTVIDIGANIGVFSLFAASKGAKQVYAYEPNSQAFQILQRNITENHLESAILPYQLFVTGSAGREVRFPMSASPYNRKLDEGFTGDSERVLTTDLSSIIADNDIEDVQILKLDCEGSEYEIVPAVPAPVWEKVHDLRMEFHNGDHGELIDTLRNQGFQLLQLRLDTPSTGSIRFHKT